MLDINRVGELFSLFADLEGEARRPWDSFCAAAADYIEGRLRPDTDVAAHMETLCICAAGLAYADYLTVHTALDGGELRVGDIAVKDSADINRDAAELRDHFLGRAAHLLRPRCPGLMTAEAEG